MQEHTDPPAGISGAQVLRWRKRWPTEFARGAQHEVRIPQQFASERNQVGMTIGDYRVCLRGRRDEPDRHRGDSGFVTYSRRERHLISRPRLDLLLWRDAPRRAIDDVYPVRPEFTGERDGVIAVPTVLNPVGA